MIDKIFGDGGWLSAVFPGYRLREGQVELARQVEKCIKNGGVLLSEAKTGVGKSLAYGLPSAVHALTQGKAVVIATANIALQEQLFYKDFPTISDVLADKPLGGGPTKPLKYASVKGLSNYLCLRKFDEVHSTMDAFEPWFKEIKAWQKDTKLGDKSELSEVYAPAVWGKLSSTPDECIKGECPMYDECYGLAARRVDDGCLIVTNYHMLFADAEVRQATEGAAGILPDYDVLVLDEAHKAADIAMDFHGFDYSASSILWSSRCLSNIQEDDARTVQDALRASVAAFFADLEAYSRKNDSILSKPLGWDCNVVAALRSASLYLQSRAKRAEAGEVQETPPKIAYLKRMSLVFERQSYALEDVAFGDGESGELPSGRVYFIELSPKGEAHLRCKAVDVRDFFQMLFEEKAVVATSATLATHGNFSFAAREFGLGSGGYASTIVESPFAADRVLVVIPDMPPPQRQDEHDKALSDIAATVVGDLGGKTMVLFTSHGALRRVSQMLRPRLRDTRMYVQGELPKRRIIDEFKEAKNGLILATASFWEGVDIPGEALSCVVIQKLPFVPPTDPVLRYLEASLSAYGKSAFFEYSVPKAMIALKQAVGRLIRSEKDCGAIILCDPRVKTAGYGKAFNAAFPTGCFYSEDPSDVALFIEDIRSSS